MPSPYVLARDHIEQARAMLTNEVWFDAEIDHMLNAVIVRLNARDQDLQDRPFDRAPRPPAPRRSPRLRLMPWLDR